MQSSLEAGMIPYFSWQPQNHDIPSFSLAGFLTARILADYFTKVIIIETDLQLDASGLSRRVGQRSQTHVYLSIGLDILRALFPNFDAEARSAGAM